MTPAGGGGSCLKSEGGKEGEGQREAMGAKGRRAGEIGGGVWEVEGGVLG